MLLLYLFVALRCQCVRARCCCVPSAMLQIQSWCHRQAAVFSCLMCLHCARPGSANPCLTDAFSTPQPLLCCTAFLLLMPSAYFPLPAWRNLHLHGATRTQLLVRALSS